MRFQFFFVGINVKYHLWIKRIKVHNDIITTQLNGMILVKFSQGFSRLFFFLNVHFNVATKGSNAIHDNTTRFFFHTQTPSGVRFYFVPATYYDMNVFGSRVRDHSTMKRSVWTMVYKSMLSIQKVIKSISHNNFF